MKIFLTTSEGTKEITNMVTDATLSGDYQTAARTLKFGVVSNYNDKSIPVIKCDLGSGIVMTENGENIFNGFIIQHYLHRYLTLYILLMVKSPLPSVLLCII